MIDGAGRSDAAEKADAVIAGSKTFSCVLGLAPRTSFANSGAGKSVCNICCDCIDFHRDRLSRRWAHSNFFKSEHTGHTVPRSTILKNRYSVIVDTFVNNIMRSLSASSGDDMTNSERYATISWIRAFSYNTSDGTNENSSIMTTLLWNPRAPRLKKKVRPII